MSSDTTVMIGVACLGLFFFIIGAVFGYMTGDMVRRSNG